jgi:hypothetical protein
MELLFFQIIRDLHRQKTAPKNILHKKWSWLVCGLWYRYALSPKG